MVENNKLPCAIRCILFLNIYIYIRIAELDAGCGVVQTTEPADFISIDYGSTKSYTDSATGINYVPDTGYINRSASKSISTLYETSYLETQFQNVRSFPDGDRNCYTLKPHQVEGTQYLIRARFMYGNYDSLNRLPEFDLYIGGNFWTTVKIAKPDVTATSEIIHDPPSTITYVCLVNKGKGIPFKSVLELRRLSKKIYNSTSGSMTLVGRLNLGSEYEYRYRIMDDNF